MTVLTGPIGQPADTIGERPYALFKRVASAAVLAIVVWSAIGLDLKWGRLWHAPADLLTVAKLMFGRMTWDDTGHLLQSMWQSVAIAWLGTMLASIFAIPLSFLAAQNVTGKAFGGVVRQLFNVLRSVPEILLAIIMVPIFGLTAVAGMVAIGIGSIGTLSKLGSESIEGIRPGPLEAAEATGATALQRLRWGVLPQVVPEMMSYILYRFEINIRVSAVVGMVGAGGIGNDLNLGLRFKEWGLGGQALLIVVVSTVIIDMISGWVRRRLLAGPGVSLHFNPDLAASTPTSNTAGDAIVPIGPI